MNSPLPDRPTPPAENRTIERPLAPWAALRQLPREAIVVGVCVLAGLTVAPMFVWACGKLFLGEYASGGPLALWREFLAGLGRGSLPYWAIAAAPYLAVLGVRAIRWVLRF
jgi:hypothetical protein